ncbi:MAG TPA: spherulation-specific family 4 protein [Kineosporiaceae bacterium]|nr:spherulation-specific family 4 protein [Kineosporiaceae bacterium]
MTGVGGEDELRRDLDLLVPAYAHPLADPEAWQRLVALAPWLRAVIVNVHNGPGDGEDAAYPDVLKALQEAGVRTVGYVDTDYGRRPVPQVVADVEAWLARYDVRGVFLDQVATGLDLLDQYADVTVAARARGADYVVLNPGAVPHPGYVDLANITITFEGPWRDYRRLAEPEWVRALPTSRFAHLVHEVPDAEALAASFRRAGRHHVRTFYATTGGGDNPWGVIPAELVELLGARSG